MALVINNNAMAANVARTLNTHYGNLATSTQRLSSGLRINSAADDAAGLAIRELMRADVAALNQGVRNANDAISMIQVVDGALSVIDEKLIRMKELAEQAATGTYDSTQRLMIDSEFQAMASEIQRIAVATDFNGIKLLNSNIIDSQEQSKISINNIHEITSRYDKKYTPSYSVDGLVVESEITETRKGTIKTEYETINSELYKKTTNNIEIITDEVRYEQKLIGLHITYTPSYNSIDTNPQHLLEIINPDTYDLLDNIPISHTAFDDKIIDFDYIFQDNIHDFAQENGGRFDERPHRYRYHLDLSGNGEVDCIVNICFKDFVDPEIVKNSWNIQGFEYRKSGPVTNQTITRDDSIRLEKVIDPTDHIIGNKSAIIIHFGTMNDSGEDYYGIEKRDCTLKCLGLEDVRIETQDNAQKALITINDAIVKKDQVRAYYGAMQNRLENTVSNLTIQAENLQASESRISDVDVATEMTNFVRNQILTQSAVAMLSQANSMPQMAMQLIGG